MRAVVDGDRIARLMEGIGRLAKGPGTVYLVGGATALAKIERGHVMDLNDVRAMIDRGLVQRALLTTFFERVAPDLLRYPAIDGQAFRAKVQAVVDRVSDDDANAG